MITLTPFEKSKLLVIIANKLVLKNSYNELPQYRKNKYATDYCLEDIEAFAVTLNQWKKQ